jgi:hypothetical protein
MNTDSLGKCTKWLGAKGSVFSLSSLSLVLSRMIWHNVTVSRSIVGVVCLCLHVGAAGLAV